MNVGGFELLTDREREVLDYVARGFTNAEIAASLYLSRHTIKDYIGQTMEKLGARNRTEMAVAYSHATLDAAAERADLRAAERTRTAAIEAFLVWNDRGRRNGVTEDEFTELLDERLVA